MKGTPSAMEKQDIAPTSGTRKIPFSLKLKRETHFLFQNYELLLFLLPAVVIIILFNYVPMYGVQIAFRDFSPGLGITGSPWVGFKHFMRFFNSFNSVAIIKNTVLLSLYSMIWSFPMPILLALMLNQISKSWVKRTIQTVTYLPYFISTVVMVGMIFLFLSPERGLYGALMNILQNKSAPNLLSEPSWFRTVYISTGIWQTTGFASVIYLAALSGVDPELYEAAVMDGAGKMQRLIHIDLPFLMPTIAILFILSMGNLMNVGFEKTYLLQNAINNSVSEVLATYVYKVGLVNAQYSFSSAVNLFNTAINVILLLLTNFASKRMSQNSLL
jgi:putative aldouronate transport system permease protein